MTKVRALGLVTALVLSLLVPTPTSAIADVQVRRLSGDGRVETAAAVAQATRVDPTAVDTVVLATADDYPDALAGAPLAALLDAPLLLTGGEGLHAAAAAEVRRLRPTTAVLLGGAAALSQQVEQDLRALGVRSVQRYQGSTRFGTAAAVAERIVGPAPQQVHAYVVEGADPDPARGWPDAVAVSGLAALQRRPILLVDTDRLPADTAAALRRLAVSDVTIVGGTGAVSQRVEQAIREAGVTVGRVAGATRYETSRRVADVARAAGADPARTWFATGRNWPDALSAGPAAAFEAGVLLLLDGRDLDGSPPARAWLAETLPELVTLVGGPAAISAAVEAEIRASDGSRADPPAGDVLVDVRERFQVMQGFGASARVWEDPHVPNYPVSVVPVEAQEQVLEALFTRLGLTRVRSVLDPGLEPVNDNGDPFVLDASRLDYRGKRADAHVALVQQARAHGLAVWFPTVVNPEGWLPGEPRYVEEYVEWALAMLLRWRALGAEPPFFSVYNEPAISPNANTSPEWMVEVVALLGRRMREAGLSTLLVIPDDLNPAEALRRAEAVLADERARPYVGALAYHLYAGAVSDPQINPDLEALRRLAERHGVPVWMTEFSRPRYGQWPDVVNWGQRIHQVVTVGGASAVDYMWAFFGNRPQYPHTLVWLDMVEGVYQGHELTPAYHVTGQFSRFVRPGFVRVGAETALPQVSVSAFAAPDGRVVVVAVNGGSPRPGVRFAVAGRGLAGPVQRVRSSAGEDGVGLPALQAEEGVFTADLPAASVTTFLLPAP